MNNSFSQVLRLACANAKGTGSLLSMSVVPASHNNPGCLIVSISPQSGLGFDMERTNTFALSFSEIGKVLQVFRGESESISDGKGIVSRSAGSAFNLRHVYEPSPAYILCITANSRTESFSLNSATALALTHAIEGSLSRIAFGDPGDIICVNEHGEEIAKPEND